LTLSRRHATFAALLPQSEGPFEENKMKRSVLIAVTFGALLLAGCGLLFPKSYLPTLEERKNPEVTVVNGEIKVPYVLVFRSGENDIPITWRLPADRKFRFPKNGIVIEGAVLEQVIRQPREGVAAAVVLDPRQTEITCNSQEGGLTFSCLNRNAKRGVLYKYTVRVIDETGKELVRDPFVMNDL